MSRLLIATPLYPPEPGGPATYAHILELGMPEHGIQPLLVKWSEVKRYPKILRHLMYCIRVYRLGRHADAVLALDPVSTGLPASIAAALLRKPFYVKIVGDYAWEQGTQRFGITDSLNAFVRRSQVPFAVGVLRAVQTHVAKCARKVIVPSEYLKHIVSLWGIPESKLDVIYNAIELEEEGMVSDAIAKLSRPKIVSIGRLVSWKHVEGVIDAVAALATPASLIIVGDGPEQEYLEWHAQQALPAAHFTGALPHKEALAILKDADVLVLNSSYEGLSHLLIEALQLGKVIVATSIGGNPELIVDNKHGLLIPPHNTQALTGALGAVLDDISLREHLEAGALERGRYFTTDRMLEHTIRTLGL